MKRVLLVLCLAVVTPAAAAVSSQQATQLDRHIAGWAYAVTSVERMGPDILIRECFDPEALRQRTLMWNWRADLEMRALYDEGTVPFMREELLPITRDFIAWTRTPEGKAADNAALTMRLQTMILERWESVLPAWLKNRLREPLGATDGPTPLPDQKGGCAEGYCECSMCPVPDGQGRCDCLTVQYDDPLNPSVPTGCAAPRKDCDATIWESSSPAVGEFRSRLTKNGSSAD